MFLCSNNTFNRGNGLGGRGWAPPNIHSDSSFFMHFLTANAQISWQHYKSMSVGSRAPRLTRNTNICKRIKEIPTWQIRARRQTQTYGAKCGTRADNYNTTLKIRLNPGKVKPWNHFQAFKRQTKVSGEDDDDEEVLEAQK